MKTPLYFLQYGGCVNDKSQQMGVRKPGLSKGTLREKDVGQRYSSPCPQVSLQGLRQSILHHYQNQEVLSVFSVRQPWLSKGTEMAA